MQDSEKPGSLTDQEKSAISILLEEYKIVSGGISQQLIFQGQAITLSITIVAAAVAAFVSLVSSHRLTDYYSWILLALPLLISALGMWIVDKDEMIINMAKYNDKILKVEMEKICKHPVLQYEDYLRKRRFSRNYGSLKTLARFFSALFPHAILGLLNICCLIGLFHLNRQPGYARLTHVQWIIFCVDFFSTIVFAFSAYTITREYEGIESNEEIEFNNQGCD